MSMPLAGQVQTVLGPVAPGDLGVTLPHEHLLADFRKGMVGPRRDLDLTMENLGTIGRFPYSVPQNILLDSVEEATSEMQLFRKAGGGAVCELSVLGMRCDSYHPHQLTQISKETSVNIIHATGFYWDSFLPERMRGMGVSEMKDLMEEEICGGARRGVIYIGCSLPLKESEQRALEAAALTQKETGAPLIVHPGRNEASPFEILQILTSHGGNISHTAITHLDRTVPSEKRLLQLARTGCYLNHSFFGKECSHYQYDSTFDMPSDAQRVQKIKLLVDSGFTSQVLISHDIVCRHEFVCYGGHGYAHILEHVVPKMVERGISRDTVTDILTLNPQTWLTFV